MKNKEELPPNLNRGSQPTQLRFELETELAATEDVLRPQVTGSARGDQPALTASTVQTDDATLLEEDLMELIFHPRNVDRAWRRVKRNRGAPGPDGMTIKEFEPWAQANWQAVKEQLLDGTYRPSPVRRKTIQKEGGGERLLGIPNVLDRLIQQAILQILTPTFDPEFSDSSFGFRPNRSCHGAIKQAQTIIRQGYRHVVDIDLSKFFDRVQHDVLMQRVSRKIHDKRLLKLIGRYLRAGVMIEGVVQPTEEGTPQGGPASPMLSNILLDDLDKELERRGLKFVRYADDFLIFVKSSRSAQRVFGSVQRYLERSLKLVVNQTKSCVRVAEGCEFLGFMLVGKRATVKVSPKKLKAFKRRIKELTGRSRGISIKRRLTELRRYVRGWIGYFGLAKQVEDFLNLDGWIRRRVRMCYWKQWRYARTKVKKLRELGVTLDLAIKHAISRKSHWRMSRTPAMRIAMPNHWLAEQGVLSLSKLWYELAPLRRIA